MAAGAPLTIRLADPGDSAALGLLEQSWAHSAASAPAHAQFHYGLDELRASNVRLFLAERGAAPVGCAAYAHQAADWGELKSMFVLDAARGSGVAEALVGAIVDAAQAAGARHLRLETGVDNERARAFYTRMGFSDRGRFDPYPDEPLSHFMEMDLDGTAARVRGA